MSFTDFPQENTHSHAQRCASQVPLRKGSRVIPRCGPHRFPSGKGPQSYPEMRLTDSPQENTIVMPREAPHRFPSGKHPQLYPETRLTDFLGVLKPAKLKTKINHHKCCCEFPILYSSPEKCEILFRISEINQCYRFFKN